MNLNWRGLAQPNQTIVFYMGLKGLPLICEKLMEHGLPADLPMALVQQATTPRQRVFTGTLGTMPERIASEEVKPPTLIIVGNVVKLHDKLNWYRSELMIEKGEH
jgi:uroporphyrin-III C-methyltransferase/precorrin-2 dehydrogenase/sirohydrochlorin ferrochelatase